MRRFWLSALLLVSWHHPRPIRRLAASAQPLRRKRSLASVVVAVSLIVAFPRTGRGQATGVCYDASLGTLPQNQGWLYADEDGNPLPFVSAGLLHESTTAGGQYFYRLDSAVDFSQGVTLEANLRVNYSNYVPNVGTGTREGYYFILRDRNNPTEHTIGLASTGFNINTVQVPNHPLTPFPIADGNFHTYRLQILNGNLSFYIDGTRLAAGVSPFNDNNPLTYNVLFGGVAGASVSDTDLSYLCYNHAPPSSNNLLKSSGDTQAGIPLSSLPNPLVIQVNDQTGNPVDGVPISFQVTQEPAGVQTHASLSVTSTTTTNGLASTQLTLGDQSGQYQVTASCTGGQTCTPSSVVFTETAVNVAPPECPQCMSGAFIAPNSMVALDWFCEGGCTMNLVGAYQVHSGGHQHEDLQHPGSSIMPNSGFGDHGQPLSVSLQTTRVGQNESVVACRSDYPKICTAFVFSVGYAGFVNIGDSPVDDYYEPPGAGYVLIGATATHPSNHWGTSNTASSMLGALGQYRMEYPQYDKPGLNDMALPEGGLFDINADWDVPHNDHDRGTAADVRGDATKPFSIPRIADVQDRFQAICREKGATLVLHEDAGTSNEHFHCEWP